MILVAAVAVLSATACAKLEMDPSMQDGVTTFTCELVDTKITLGSKDGQTYPALWEKGDQIAVYNVSTSKLIGTATLKSGQGDRKGVFQMPGTVSKGTKIKVVYPADAGFVIPAEQYQAETDKSVLPTRAESAQITADGSTNINFSLTHTAAIVKVTISTTEFADMKLKSVLLYSKGKTLNGNEDDNDYVRVNFKALKPLSGTQSAVFTTEPLTTASDFYVAVTMAKDNKTVTIPILYKGKTLNANQVNLIKISSLSLSSNAVDWYNPECTRYIPQGAWCYGTNNSMMFATDGTSKKYDVRAQGDFLGVIKYGRKPAKLQLRLGDMVDPGNAGMWSVNGETPKKKAYVSLPADYKPAVFLAKTPQNNKKSVVGLFNLCDENDNVIWAFLCWASSPSQVTLPKTGTVIMDRNLGGSGADALTEEEQRGTLYQWGRPFPFGQTPGTGTASSHPNDKVVQVRSYEGSALNADYLATIPAGHDNKDWMRNPDHINDLWGNPYSDHNSKGGSKSIFDPCPKGWKVISAAALNEVYANATWNAGTWESGMYEYPSNVAWPVTCFLNGETAARGGTSKGLYFADSPWDINYGTHFEYERTTGSSHPKTFNGTWKSNACAVRCMKDPENNDAEALPDVGETPSQRTFTNPVISTVLADPTIWKVGDEFRVAGTGLGFAFSSTDMVSWPLASTAPVDADNLAKCKANGSNLWAPDVVRIGNKYMLYVTCYTSLTSNSIVALESSDGKEFTYVGVITSCAKNGIKDTIDPEVVVDSDGKVWMFFGASGGIHRVQLNSTGTALASGASYTHVAGLDVNNNSNRSKVFEGAYLHYRDGYWYMFASAGNYADYTYKIVVGRSSSLTGTFKDKNGNNMTAGNATTLMSSGSSDSLYGPGHNAEIFTDSKGQDYIFYHCHSKAVGAGADLRYGCLQRLYWGSDGWPYVTDGKPAATDVAPRF